MNLLLAGGRQGRAAGALDRDHAALYEEALLIEVDPESGTAVVRLRWRDPEWPGLGHCFKGASWDGERLLLCTERALLWVDPTRWEVVERWTHPWLNDVHHAIRHDGALWVASTGLDAVLEVRGQAVQFHGLGSTTAPVDDARAADHRPHAVHPNHLFVCDGALWVTRFHDRSATTLDGRSLPLGLERLHDGNPVGDGVWFTRVDGQLVRGPEPVALPLQPPDDSGEPLGWCRGLHLDGDDAWVGFTRIRATRFREHLAWAAGALRGRPVATRRPTRIARYSHRNGALLATIPTAPAGLDAIFAVLPRPPR